MNKNKAEVLDDTSVTKSKAPLYITLSVIAALIASYFLIPSFQESISEAWKVLTSDDEKRIKDWVSPFGLGGPLIIMLAMVLQMFLFVIPTPLLMIVSVLAYGPWWGTLIILIAIFFASSTGYLIGAYLGAPFVGRILGRKTEEKIISFIEEYGFWTVIVVRISPFLSNDAISFVAGMLRMGYWKFILATLIGITPLTLFIAYLGEDIDRLKGGLIWGSIGSIILFIAYVWWDKRRK